LFIIELPFCHTVLIKHLHNQYNASFWNVKLYIQTLVEKFKKSPQNAEILVISTQNLAFAELFFLAGAT
jgi:hypothetical protein